MTVTISCLLLTYGLFIFASQVPGAIMQNPNLSPGLQKVLREAYQEPLYTYPTSFSQGILPKAMHSHNDYWQPVPFYSALSVGAISIEADVWLYNDTLFVGHEPAALTSARTLESLYIQPILDVLRRQNPTDTIFGPQKTQNGVFDTAPDQTLYLWVDVKTDGNSTWPRVVEALEPLRSKGYLSSTDGRTFTSSAVTVIGTGSAPLSLIQPVAPRDYFWDAPISLLDSQFSNITNLTSPIASGEFPAIFGAVTDEGLRRHQLLLLRKHAKLAHEKGIMMRYWGQTSWPLSVRNTLWRQLRKEGVDLINVDDLSAAAGFYSAW